MIGLLRRLRRPAPSVDETLWRAMRAGTPWVSALDDARADRLRGLAARFLHQKTITPLAGLDLGDAQRLQLAALCCLPLLELGEAGLRGWSQLIVYRTPSACGARTPMQPVCCTNGKTTWQAKPGTRGR